MVAPCASAHPTFIRSFTPSLLRSLLASSHTAHTLSLACSVRVWHHYHHHCNVIVLLFHSNANWRGAASSSLGLDDRGRGQAAHHRDASFVLARLDPSHPRRRRDGRPYAAPLVQPRGRDHAPSRAQRLALAHQAVARQPRACYRSATTSLPAATTRRSLAPRAPGLRLGLGLPVVHRRRTSTSRL